MAPTMTAASTTGTPSWCFTEGEGRVFSTSLGHFPSAWESPAYLQHLAGGLAWALGGTAP
jgi:type 1 glutamine amidotransferase